MNQHELRYLLYLILGAICLSEEAYYAAAITITVALANAIIWIKEIRRG